MHFLLLVRPIIFYSIQLCLKNETEFFLTTTKLEPLPLRHYHPPPLPPLIIFPLFTSMRPLHLYLSFSFPFLPFSHTLSPNLLILLLHLFLLPLLHIIPFSSFFQSFSFPFFSFKYSLASFSFSTQASTSPFLLFYDIMKPSFTF